MNITTHHTAKTVRGRRYWRAVVQDHGERAFVEIAQIGDPNPFCDNYSFTVSTDGGSRYTGYTYNRRDALARAAHYAWHVTHPNDRNPY